MDFCSVVKIDKRNESIFDTKWFSVHFTGIQNRFYSQCIFMLKCLDIFWAISVSLRRAYPPDMARRLTPERK